MSVYGDLGVSADTNPPPSQTGSEQTAGSPLAAADPARRPAPRPEDSAPQRCRCSPGDQTEPASSGSPGHCQRQRLYGSSPGLRCRSAPCGPATGKGRPDRQPGQLSDEVITVTALTATRHTLRALRYLHAELDRASEAMIRSARRPALETHAPANAHTAAPATAERHKAA
jgi:hypothetical protein